VFVIWSVNNEAAYDRFGLMSRINYFMVIIIVFVIMVVVMRGREIIGEEEESGL
jgi:hypothetical protein